ncbi:MAG: ABC transporter permease, partial [Armatimonadota bacterium]|nr:ABC transporter permease [Armatimonadota bacterium]
MAEPRLAPVPAARTRRPAPGRSPADPRGARPRARTLWRQFGRHRAGLVGLATLTAFLIAGLFAPWLAPRDPYEIALEASLRGPDRDFWLGRDELGRDLLSRVIYGARLSLVIGVIAVAIGVGFGVPIGAISGYFGGWLDLLVQRAIDVLLAFPGILLAIVLVAILGVGLPQVMVAVGIVSIPVYARLVRGQVLTMRSQEFVDAARALGAPTGRILWRHILPNTVAVIIVQSRV